MNAEEVALLRQVSDELQRARERLHKVIDLVQSHEGKIREQEIMLAVVRGELATLKQAVATREHVDSGVVVLNQKLDHLEKAMEPIKSGVYWAVALILGAVILALVALVVRVGTAPVGAP